MVQSWEIEVVATSKWGVVVGLLFHKWLNLTCLRGNKCQKGNPVAEVTILSYVFWKERLQVNVQVDDFVDVEVALGKLGVGFPHPGGLFLQVV